MATPKEQLAKLQSRIAKIRENSAEAIRTGVAAIEVTTMAGGLNYLRGRFPKENEDGTVNDEFEVAGVPVNLAVGVLLHGLAFAGAIPQQYGEHAHNLGNGALADYAGQQLFRMGRDSLNEKRKGEGKPALSGGSAGGSAALSGGAMPQFAPPPYNPYAQGFAHQAPAFRNY